jgi:hypothetical protein
MAVFYVVTPCGHEGRKRRFGQTFFFHHLGSSGDVLGGGDFIWGQRNGGQGGGLGPIRVDKLGGYIAHLSDLHVNREIILKRILREIGRESLH